MIGIAHGRLRYCPCRFPWQILLIDQHAHEFGNGKRGMRVVELYGNFLVKHGKRVMLFAEAACDIPQRAGYEKILLHQPQFSAAKSNIRGVENF